MASQIHLRLGARPWQPADTARPGKVLNHYDIPLAGILKQHGEYYLFECLEGETQEASLWAYVPISHATARKLRRLTGDQLTSAMHSSYSGQTITVALALSGRIEQGESINVPVRQEAARTGGLRSAQDTTRAEGLKALQRKADRDKSAVDCLVAVV